MALHVGDRAPKFEAVAHDGTTVGVGSGVIVLYFYPKNETTGCTAEACRFRDDYEDFVDAGAQVIGVSADSDESHRDFAENHRLPFHLVSDTGGELRKAFDVGRTLGIVAGRVTYVIDARGYVRHVFNSQLRATKHVAEALRIVKAIARENQRKGRD